MLAWSCFLIACVLWGWHIAHWQQRYMQKDAQTRKLMTKNKQLKQQLIQQDHHRDTLFENIDEALFRINQYGQILESNQHAHHYFKVSSDWPYPQSMLVYYRDPEWQTAYQQALRALPKTTKLPHITLAEKTLATRLSPWGDQQALLCCLDISEQIQAQQQQQRFMTNILHDLKTPLTCIYGYAKSLHRFQGQPDIMADAIDTIQYEAQRMHELIESLTQIENLDKKALGQCIAREVLSQYLDQQQYRFKQQGIQLHCCIEEEHRYIGLSSLLFTRIISNIIDNALQHGLQQKAGCLMVSLQCQQKMLQLSIADDGAGVAEKDLKHLSERFYCADSSRSEQSHGLGLAIVAELIAAAQGTLEFSSQQGEGLCLHINLPWVSNEQAS